MTHTLSTIRAPFDRAAASYAPDGTPGPSAARFGYARDPIGRIASRTIAVGGAASGRAYAYDALERLASETVSGGADGSSATASNAGGCGTVEERLSVLRENLLQQLPMAATQAAWIPGRGPFRGRRG